MMTNAASQRRIARPSGRAIDYTGLGNIEIFPVCSHKDVAFVWRCTILCRRAAFVCRHYSDCLICRYHLTTTMTTLVLAPKKQRVLSKTQNFVKNIDFFSTTKKISKTQDFVKNAEFCQKHRIVELSKSPLK